MPMKYRNETVVCEGCGELYQRPKKGAPERRQYCRSCVRSGDRSPTWKGGHSNWQKGKLGRDKDGLSWKIQRELCRERDNHTCQDCGKTREELGYEPDCDHEIPYRVSESHALENLKLRCRSCHKKAEAQRKELWGGSTLGGNLGRIKRSRCTDCGSSRRKKNQEGRCSPCQRENYDIPLAKEMREKGASFAEISVYFGVSPEMVSYWLTPRKLRTMAL